MNFWEHFLRLLFRRPKPALAALYWHMTKRKVRARNRLRVASADLPFVYAAWIRANERNDELTTRCASVLEDSDWHPRFLVWLHSTSDCSNDDVIRSRRSVDLQKYPAWAVAGPVPDDSPDSWLAMDADYLVPLRVGDELSTFALFRLAEAARKNRHARILFGDEDRLDEHGRRGQPWFKPQWNEEMFLAQDYLSSCAAIEWELARRIGARNEPSDISSFMLAATSAAKNAIIHVPQILCHVRPREPEKNDRVRAVGAHLGSLCADCVPGPFETVRVRWPLPTELPLVSIIIPTKDKVELLEACIGSVLAKTTYEPFEILVVDNKSVETRTAEYLERIRDHPSLRILDYPHPYNFSELNNFAVEHARGDYLCLLNNDTEVLEPEWLTEMMRYAVRTNVGAVGAKLLYEDGSIQHAGVVIGIGDAAGHAHRLLPGTDCGYFKMPHVAQFVSAVTAACLVVVKTKFEAVGGFDPELAVAFNDVDFCLKLQALGWQNVYVPHAVLVHHESKTRGKDEAPQNVNRFRREIEILQRRWGTMTYVDPVHNPNLDRYSETFVTGG